MREKTQKYRLMVSTLLAGCFAVSYGAVAQIEPTSSAKNTYEVELKLYQIQLSETPGDIAYYTDSLSHSLETDRITQALESKSVSFRFEKMHLRGIFEFFSNNYQINMVLDQRVIRPESTETSEDQDNLTEEEYVTDGIVEFHEVNNFRLDQGLTTLLRPLGLAYSVQPGFIWISTPEKIASESFGQFYRPSSVFTFRTNGAYVFHGKETLLLGRPDLTWSGKPKPDNRDIHFLSNPRMLLKEGQRGEIFISDNTPIQYFVRSKDDTYLLKTLDINGGFKSSFTVEATETKDEASILLSLDATLVGGRSPLEGVHLDVGRPSVLRTKHSDAYRMPLGRWTSLLGSAKSFGALLLCVKVEAGETVANQKEARAEKPAPNELPTQYVIDTQVLRYRGRLDEDELGVAFRDQKAAGLPYRLKDGILPLRLRREKVNLRDTNTLLRLLDQQAFELVGAPHITLLDKKATAENDSRGLMIVFSKNFLSAGRVIHAGESLSNTAPEEHILPLSDGESSGTRLAADVISQWHEVMDSEDKADKPHFREMLKGVTLLVGVHVSDGVEPATLDFYTQFRTVASKNSEDAEFVAFRDQIAVSEIDPTAYLFSVSETVHYITLISVHAESTSADTDR